MPTQVASLEAVFTADTTNFDRGAARVERGITGMGSRISGGMQNIGSSITGLGSALTGLALPIAAAFGVAITAGARFETAFTNVIKTVDATESELTALEDAISSMATDASNPLSALDDAHVTLANIMAVGGQLGVATDDLIGFTQVMGELGIATDLTAEEAALLTARFANVTGMSFDNLGNLGSTLVALGNSAATSESEIMSMASRIAAAGSQAGMAEHEILGISAALSAAGISAELGGSNFSRVLGEIALAVANGGEELNGFASVAGMTANEFSELWGTDATAAITAFVGGLGDMDQATQLQTLQGLGLTGQEVTRVLTTLAGNTDVLTDSLATAATGWAENTALTAEAIRRTETLEGKTNLLKNMLFGLGNTIYETLEPALKGMIDAVAPIIESVVAWVEENPQLVQGIAAVAVGVAGLGAVLVPLGMAIGAIGTVMGVILSPIGLVIAAVVALGAAFATNFGGIRDAVMPILERLAGWFREELLPAVTTVINNHVMPAVETFVNFLSGMWEVVGPHLTNLGNWFLNDVMPAIGQVITNVVLPALGRWFDLMAAVWGVVGPALISLADWFLNTALPVIVKFIENVVIPAVEGFIGILSGIWDAVQPALQSLQDGMSTVFTWIDTNVIQPFLGVVEGIGSAISGVVSTVLNAFSGLGVTVIDAINNAIPNEVNLGNLGPLGNVSINLPDNPIPGGSSGGGGGGGGITTTATFENQLSNNPLLTGNLSGGGQAPVTVNGVTINANSAEGGAAAADGFFNRINEIARANG